MKKSNLKSTLNNVFYVISEKNEDEGEDSVSYHISENGGMICAADGCGSIGAKKYVFCHDKTGAYIASRNAVITMYDIFCDMSAGGNIDVDFDFADELIYDFNREVVGRIKRYEEEEPDLSEKYNISALSRPFPASLCASVFNTGKDTLDAAFIWAGNTRGYILSDTLIPVTHENSDEQESISRESSDKYLTNIISADGDFHINCEIMTSDLPGAVIVATDGAVSCFRTPIEFEYMLLYTLEKSRNINSWHNNIYGELSQISKEDFTVCAAIMGYESFDEFKNRYAKRADMLYKKYILPLNNDNVYELCEKYRRESEMINQR